MTRTPKTTSSAAKKAGRGKAGGDEPELSFEEALERIEAIVTRLEEGEIPLEKSIEAYAEGTHLVRQCLQKLEEAERTIQKLSEESGGFRLEPADLESGVADEAGTEETKGGDDDALSF